MVHCVTNTLHVYERKDGFAGKRSKGRFQVQVCDCHYGTLGYAMFKIVFMVDVISKRFKVSS